MPRSRLTPIFLSTVALILCLSLFAFDGGAAAERVSRPDLIVLLANKTAGELERPPVQFAHDLHTEAVTKRGEDCTACHPLLENGRLSRLFMRAENVEGQDLEQLYHDACITCHNKYAAADSTSGPVACGDCHRKVPVYSSSRQPFGFDKSLHYRHIKAQNEKCGNCHHQYDEDSRKLVYVEGQEDPCRDCHRERTEDNRISFRLAAHMDCVGCHRQTSIERPDDPTGPVSCGGCHDREQQKAIKVVENPPRLKRGQPDFVLLSAPEAELQSSKLNTVPFPHAEHEQFMSTCRACHHETLSRCSDCHDLAGIEKGAGVTLQQAMHRLTSKHSCIGCHQSQELARQCAGCHDLMEQGRLSENSCNICHVGPPPENLEEVRPLYKSLDMFRSRPSAAKFSAAAREVPDSVVIASLSGKHPPITMPHGKIVDKLRKNVENSRVATYFHGNDEVLCQGCHHHGSIGNEPALCQNCHGQPFRESDLFKPGLYGAYHRQCVGCHVSMGLQKASDCAVCHKTADMIEEGLGDTPLNEGASNE
jgi:hypothetical protein